MFMAYFHLQKIHIRELSFRINKKVCRSNIDFVLNQLKNDFIYLTKVSNDVTLKKNLIVHSYFTRI